MILWNIPFTLTCIQMPLNQFLSNLVCWQTQTELNCPVWSQFDLYLRSYSGLSFLGFSKGGGRGSLHTTWWTTYCTWFAAYVLHAICTLFCICHMSTSSKSSEQIAKSLELRLSMLLFFCCSSSSALHFFFWLLFFLFSISSSPFIFLLFSFLFFPLLIPITMITYTEISPAWCPPLTFSWGMYQTETQQLDRNYPSDKLKKKKTNSTSEGLLIHTSVVSWRVFIWLKRLNEEWASLI